MARKSGRKLMGLVLLAVIVGGGGYLLLNDDSSGFTFEMPPLAFYGEGNNNLPDVGVHCKVKQTLHVYDGAGFEFATVQSELAQGSPLISQTITSQGTTGRGISSMTVEPKIFCDVGNTGFLDMKVNPSFLTVHIYVEDHNGNLKLAKSYGKTTFNNVAFPSNTGEKTLEYFHITNTQIENALIDYDTFNSRVVFETTGLLLLEYTNGDIGDHQLFIPLVSGDIKVQYRITQHQDVFPPDPQPDCTVGYEVVSGKCELIDADNDLIGDQWDACPNSPETYNGIDDKDGCPDKATPEEPPEPEPPLECKSNEKESPDGKGCVPITETQTCNGITIPLTQTCPVNESETVQEVSDALLRGDFDTLYTVEFKDSSKRTILASQVIDTQTIIPDLTLNSIVGTVDLTPTKPVEAITVAGYYYLPTLEDAERTFLKSTAVKVKPSITVNTIDIDLQENSLAFAQAGQGKNLEDETFIGKYGLFLGEKRISATELSSLAFNQGDVQKGSTVNLEINFEFNGSFIVERSGITNTVNVAGHKVQFQDFTVNNPNNPVAEPDCESLGLVPQVQPNGLIKCVADTGESCEDLGFVSMVVEGSGDITCIDPDPEPCVGICGEPTTKECPDGVFIPIELSCEALGHGDDPTQICENGDEIPIEDTCPDGVPKTKTCPDGVVKLIGQVCKTTKIVVIGGEKCTVLIETNEVLSCTPIDGGTDDDPPNQIFPPYENEFVFLVGGALVLLLGIIAIIAKRR